MVERDLPAAILYEDEHCLAFEDIHPMSPVHILIIPKKHLATLNDATPEDRELLGHLLLVAPRIAKEKGIAEKGFRTVINTHASAGQTVFHLHVHVMGGRSMHWPPG
jgi:histidine triad (HIT) family protein